MVSYHNGLGNHLESEALPGALTKGRNSPQKPAYGLYTEQLSGSAFTVPRARNLHSWLYRIRPSVLHGEFKHIMHSHISSESKASLSSPNQMRWNPLPYPTSPQNFIEGMVTLATNGRLEMHVGAAIHLYAITASMDNIYFYNADGDYLIVPQEGLLQFKTEFGILDLKAGEIAVIPRGIKFQVILKSDKARGYVCENYGAPFHLPDLGLIGANGLANPRDFDVPMAAYEEVQADCILLAKFQGNLWSAPMKHSPLDVVAWHGNYVPYKYDLSKFNTINTVSFDHPDPSIFTVLSSASAIPGIANLDFIIFPPRWMVADDTFRPPYFHRNIMNEYMGLIQGNYDAKGEGFVPGGGSLHNCMAAHGPDAESFAKGRDSLLQPEYYDNTLAFMFESQLVWQPTEYAVSCAFRQTDYLACWQGLEAQFDKENRHVNR